MEFETLFKMILGLAAVFAIPVGAYAAVAATRAIWIRGEPGPADPALAARVEALEGRLQELEAERDRVAELEERLDFAERVLARRPEQLAAADSPAVRTPLD